VIDKLVSSLQAALKDPEVQKRYSELGAVTFPADKQTPAALEAHLKAEIAKWAPIIQKAGVYAD
jgi:tripartite-type tricarboxylate transporter receptor subunit TctC